MKQIITAVTGASGAVYAKRFVQEINKAGINQTLIISDPGREVLKYELNLTLPQPENKLVDYLAEEWQLPKPKLINFAANNDLTAPAASGSRAADALVVIPCTMGTMARVAQGLSSSLLERVHDVMLKEQKKIILVPRETPINQIHLENMLTLSRMGVRIIPAMPAFYHRPASIRQLVDFIVGRVMEHLGIEHSLYQSWSP